ncbi:CYTH domain-containing protein [Caulobacter segnis]|uniref:CYTH domain-containing protein n=1 Tax=Caulobacter segnis TaxID=88688 RepID=UPI00240F818E|nr:CYTH domain-containing protein [Caulobacter segnis]MDG2521104.1 CYTH domain-containing protein [Caulobacter segnis]
MRQQEVELKFEVDRSAFDIVTAAFPDVTFSEKRLVSTYFDTDDQALRRAGCTLRVRTGDGGGKQIFKSPGDDDSLFARDEWEAASGDAPDDVFLMETPAPGILRGRAVLPLFRIENRRLKGIVATPEGEVEIALDDAEAVAGERREAFVEMELELKSGSEAALHTVAARLRRLIDMTPSQVGKGERGYRLLD